MLTPRPFLAPLLALGLAALVTLPAAAEEVATDILEGTFEAVDWRLVGQAADGAVVEVPDGARVTLSLAGGTVLGSGGCNDYTGSYWFAPTTLEITDVSATAASCGEAADASEAAYLASLAEVGGWIVDEAGLTLTDAAGLPLLVFEPLSADEAIRAPGEWLLYEVSIDGEVWTFEDPFYAFSASFHEGTLAGRAPCYEYATSYTLDDEGVFALEGAVASSVLACEDYELQLPAEVYYAALAAATSWDVTATGLLELLDAEGELQVSFRPITR